MLTRATWYRLPRIWKDLSMVVGRVKLQAGEDIGMQYNEEKYCSMVKKIKI
jgi:hypothetical protein